MQPRTELEKDMNGIMVGNNHKAVVGGSQLRNCLKTGHCGQRDDLNALQPVNIHYKLTGGDRAGPQNQALILLWAISNTNLTRNALVCTNEEQYMFASQLKVTCPYVALSLYTNVAFCKLQ